MDVIEKAGSKQCPTCGSWDIRTGAIIEDGGIGDWCPHCKKSFQKMKLDMKKQAKSITHVIPIEFTGKAIEYFRRLNPVIPSRYKHILFTGAVEV